MRFAGKPISLARIAWNTRADHVLPSCHSTAVAWYHMIEIQIVAIENLAAILAGVLVALEHIVSRKFYLFLWKPIEKEEHDHARDANLE